MRCTNCAYEYLTVHRTSERLVTYCQQCGDERSREMSPEEKKTRAEERLRQAQEERDALSPMAKKGKKNDQGGKKRLRAV